MPHFIEYIPYIQNGIIGKISITIAIFQFSLQAQARNQNNKKSYG